MQNAGAQRRMDRNGDSLGGWLIRLQNDVASDLSHLNISPLAAKPRDEAVAAQVPRQPHGRASISSPTR